MAVKRTKQPDDRKTPADFLGKRLTGRGGNLKGRNSGAGKIRKAK